MGMFVNPDNSAFQAALNARIYIDKSGLINYTNWRHQMHLYAIADRVVLESQLLQICSQHTIVRAAIQRKCFRGWKLVNHQILRNI